MNHPQLVLCVCHAGLCRSPMMAALLTRALREAGLDERFTVSYLGVAGRPRAPHPLSLEALARLGIDGADLRSLSLSRTLFAEAVTILCADDEQLDLVHASPIPAVRAAGRLFAAQPIPDPIGRGLAEFDRTARIIQDAVPALIDHLTSL